MLFKIATAAPAARPLALVRRVRAPNLKFMLPWPWPMRVVVSHSLEGDKERESVRAGLERAALV